MNKLKTIIVSTLVIAGFLALPVVLGSAVGAAGKCDGLTAAQCAAQGAGTGNTGGNTDLGSLIRQVVNILLFVLGAIAVIMIVIGGIRYTVSGGDSSAVTSAKNTILYSIVGLVVAILAYAIVNFVLNAFK